jgi:hypothetical protein
MSVENSAVRFQRSHSIGRFSLESTFASRLVSRGGHGAPRAWEGVNFETELKSGPQANNRRPFGEPCVQFTTHEPPIVERNALEGESLLSDLAPILELAQKLKNPYDVSVAKARSS